MKATHCVIAGKEVNIFKDPATDTDKVKKSLTGRVAVVPGATGGVTVIDGLSIAEEDAVLKSGYSIMRVIFENGKLLVDESLADIRKRVVFNGS